MKEKTPKTTKLPIVIIIVVILLLCICCGGTIALTWFSFDDIQAEWNRTLSSLESVEEAEQSEETSSSSLESSDIIYPSLYTKENLPIYPNATLTNSSTEDEPLYTAITLSLESSDSVDEIVQYFEIELGKTGWEFTTDEFDYEYFYFKPFQKEDMSYNLTITRLSEDENTLIDIYYTEY